MRFLHWRIEIPLYTFQVFIWVNLKTLTRQLDESTHSTTSTMMKFCQLTKSLPTQVGKDEDPSEKERTMEKEFQTSKNTGITQELPTSKEKGKNNANWDINYSVIPKFGTVKGIALFAFEDLMQPSIVYACKPTRPFERGLSPGNAIQPIGIAEIRSRSNARPAIDSSLIQDYYKAFNAVWLVNASLENYLVIDETTKPIVNLHKRPIGLTRGHNPDTHNLLEEIQKTSLGDYWRVLRTRPPTSATTAQTLNIEYIPNNTYPYCDVKKTIGQKYPHVKVRPSRIWNESPAKDIADELLYSLSDYWPGMPIQTDIVVDN